VHHSVLFVIVPLLQEHGFVAEVDIEAVHEEALHDADAEAHDAPALKDSVVEKGCDRPGHEAPDEEGKGKPH